MVSQLLSNLLRPPFRSARHSSATLNPWSRNHAGRCKCHSPPPPPAHLPEHILWCCVSTRPDQSLTHRLIRYTLRAEALRR
jgi:hypothetical protein